MVWFIVDTLLQLPRILSFLGKVYIFRENMQTADVHFVMRTLKTCDLNAHLIFDSFPKRKNLIKEWEELEMNVHISYVGFM
jgi:hypothetical protein